MNSRGKKDDQKGAGNLYYILMGAVIILVGLAVVNYFHDRDNDVTIHLPKVEIR
jgi:hypothetical protein